MRQNPEQGNKSYSKPILMKVITILLIGGLLTSCNTQEKNTEKTSPQQEDTKQPSSMNCYRYASETDTITLKVIHVGKDITGTLVYSLKEKDKNKGTIQGRMKGDILIADYTFLSEGIQSTRQIAFKLTDNFFIEGYGESYTNNEKVYFTNTDSLTFNGSMKLAEIACL